MASSHARGVRRLVIGIVVVLVLLVAADRVSLLVAEHVAGNSIKQSQGLAHAPDVDVHGFPFLTQLAASSYDEITVTARDVMVGEQDRPLNISSIRVDLHQVDTTRNFSRVHARSATATARVSLADLGKALGITLTYAGDGRVKASKSFTIAGHTITPTITTTPTVSKDALGFASSAVNGAGGLGGEAASALEKIFGVTIPLTAIPFQIQVQRVELDQNGLALTLAGANLTYEHS